MLFSYKSKMSLRIFFVGTEIVVPKAGVRDYVNNLFRVDERQELRFINIVKSDDWIL